MWPNFVLPGDISANARYYTRDVVSNPFTLNSDSTLTVPNTVANGADIDMDYLDAVTTEKVVVRA
jgi:O-succinylbenzoate synthase